MANGPKTLAIVLSALAASVLACSNGAQPSSSAPVSPSTVPSTAGPVGGAVTEVAEDIFDFKLRSLTVAVGTTIRWSNRDPFPHTVTSGTPEAPADTWDSGNIATDDSYAYTFEQAGTYPFYCTIHPYMKATVTVTAP